MIVGRKTYKIIGYFPPMRSDPVLRLVFPREVQPTDKTVIFRLYLAGISFPEREVQFRVKDLMYHGKLAMRACGAPGLPRPRKAAMWMPIRREAEKAIRSGEVRRSRNNCASMGWN